MGCAAQNFAQSIMRSLALPPAQKIFAPLWLYWQRIAANRCRHRRRWTSKTMAPDAFRSQLSGAPCCAAKQRRSKNSRWMHLGAREVMTRQILQQFCAQHSVFATNSYFLAGYALALRQSFIGLIPVAMQQMTDHLLARTGFYSQEVTRWNLMDQSITLPYSSLWVFVSQRISS
jgi:hypothetical protein